MIVPTNLSWVWGGNVHFGVLGTLNSGVYKILLCQFRPKFQHTCILSQYMVARNYFQNIWKPSFIWLKTPKISLKLFTKKNCSISFDQICIKSRSRSYLRIGIQSILQKPSLHLLKSVLTFTNKRFDRFL